MIEFNKRQLGDLPAATRRVARDKWHWWVLVVDYRRPEHSALSWLLTAATKPPVGRIVLLSKLEETLIIR